MRAGSIMLHRPNLKRKVVWVFVGVELCAEFGWEVLT